MGDPSARTNAPARARAPGLKTKGEKQLCTFAYFCMKGSGQLARSSRHLCSLCCKVFGSDGFDGFLLVLIGSDGFLLVLLVKLGLLVNLGFDGLFKLL